MKIGQTFGNELIAAGLQDGVGWDPDSGEIFCPQGKRAEVMAIFAAHDPDAPVPAQKSEAQQLVDKIKADPAALASLKTEFSK